MAPRRNHSDKGVWCCKRMRCARMSSLQPVSTDYHITTSLERNYANIQMEQYTGKCLVDSGATHSCISKYHLRFIKPDAEIFPSMITRGIGVCGEVHPIIGEVELKLTFGQHQIMQKFKIFETLHSKVIVGLDFLKKNEVITDFGKMTMTIPVKKTRSNIYNITVPTYEDYTRVRTMSAKTCSNIVVPAHSELIFPLKVPFCHESTTLLLEPSSFLSENYQVAGGKTVSETNRGIVYYRVLNPTNSNIVIPANKNIARAEEIRPENITSCNEPSSLHLNNLHGTSRTDVITSEQQLLDLGINIDNSDLTVAQKIHLRNFLIQNRDCFAKDLSELGQTNLHHHTIYTKTERPVSSAPYRLTPQNREVLDNQLDELERNQVIERSTTPYNSPVVLVKKKNNEYRFCVDFRKLNSITEPMSFPIPRMSDVFDTLAESSAQLFTTLDLKSGFWQVPLDPETKHKSGFITHRGVYEFNRLAFGMMNAPMTFQSLMTKVLKELNFKIALVYIDDILIFSKTFDEHLNHLDLVFQHLKEANLKLNPSKCHFATKTVKYLGHIISKDGIQVNPENTNRVKEFPKPATMKHVKSFLGMANYYRKFVKNYAHIASPLTALLKKEKKFVWTLECDKAFETLKNCLISAPLLTFPKLNKPFILTTDASEYSNGYILSQMQNDREHVIAYGGRQLRGSELKWHINEKEALALVEGIQHFRHYLANQEFTVYTDNVSVKFLQKIKDSQGRLGRWSLLLQGYNFKIIHRSGNKNPADCLSRQKHSTSETQQSSDLAEHLYHLNMDTDDTERENIEVTLFYKGENVEEVNAHMSVNNINLNEDKELNLPNLATEQKKCDDFVDIFKYKQSRQVPDDPVLARTIVAESFNYEIEDGILRHFYSRRCKGSPRNERLVKQIAIPKIMRDKVLRSYHDCIAGGGHQGFERTYAALRNKYYWPSMYNDINEYVKSCETCQQSKRAFNSRPPPLNPQPTQDIFQRWHMDILSGFPTTKEKYKHVLLIVDSYSKWSEAFPMRTQEATEVADILYREVITRYGAPRSLLSDRGRNFMSNVVKALSELFNIKRYHTSSYHPQTNGAVERMNSVIIQALRAYTKDQQDDWNNYLPGIMMAYRATPATQSTDFSPFFLLFGREMTLPIDTALIPKDHLSQEHKIFLARIISNLENTRKIAAENIQQAQQRYKQNYDKNTRIPEFRLAQRVWLYCTKVPQGKAPKLHRKWVGPYYICELGPNYTFKLRNCSSHKEVKSLVNVQRLKPYYDPAQRPTNQPEQIAETNEELDPEEIEDAEIPNTDDQINQHPAPSQDHENTDNQDRNSDQTPADASNDNQNNNNGNNNNNNGKNKRKYKQSCKDCENGNCRPFLENQIDSIVASSRSNGKLYYKVKFKDKTQKTSWWFPCKVPGNLVREFHTKRRPDGRKRKRSLKNNHKFFEQKDANVNSLRSDSKTTTCTMTSVNSETQTENPKIGEPAFYSEKLLSIRIMNNKLYFLIKTPSSIVFHSILTAYQHARKFVKDLKQQNYERSLEYKRKFWQRKYQPDRGKKYFTTSDATIYEVMFLENGETLFLTGFLNNNIPPEWTPFDTLSPASVNRLIDLIDCQWDQEVCLDQNFE